jgi:hypothetical protein
VPTSTPNRKGSSVKTQTDPADLMLEIANQPAPPGFAEDSAGLGPLPVGRVVIGDVHGVNDEGARLVPTFIPTAYELEVLARHYVKAIYDIEYFGRFAQTSGSYEIRFGPFADRRLGTIAETLGREVFDGAIAPVRHDHEKDVKDTEERLAKPCAQCGCARDFFDLGRPMREYEDDGLCEGCYKKGAGPTSPNR